MNQDEPGYTKVNQGEPGPSQSPALTVHVGGDLVKLVDHGGAGAGADGAGRPRGPPPHEGPERALCMYARERKQERKEVYRRGHLVSGPDNMTMSPALASNRASQHTHVPLSGAPLTADNNGGLLGLPAAPQLVRPQQHVCITRSSHSARYTAATERLEPQRSV